MVPDKALAGHFPEEVNVSAHVKDQCGPPCASERR